MRSQYNAKRRATFATEHGRYAVKRLHVNDTIVSRLSLASSLAPAFSALAHSLLAGVPKVPHDQVSVSSEDLPSDRRGGSELATVKATVPHLTKHFRVLDTLGIDTLSFRPRIHIFCPQRLQGKVCSLLRSIHQLRQDHRIPYLRPIHPLSQAVGLPNRAVPLYKYKSQQLLLSKVRPLPLGRIQSRLHSPHLHHRRT